MLEGHTAPPTEPGGQAWRPVPAPLNPLPSARGSREAPVASVGAHRRLLSHHRARPGLRLPCSVRNPQAAEAVTAAQRLLPATARWLSWPSPPLPDEGMAAQRASNTPRSLAPPHSVTSSRSRGLCTGCLLRQRFFSTTQPHTPFSLMKIKKSRQPGHREVEREVNRAELA